MSLAFAKGINKRNTMTGDSVQLPSHALTPEPHPGIYDVWLSSKYYTGFLEICTEEGRISEMV